MGQKGELPGLLTNRPRMRGTGTGWERQEGAEKVNTGNWANCVGRGGGVRCQRGKRIRRIPEEEVE